MESGLLNQQITILSPKTTFNEYGEEVTSYEPSSCINAHVVYNKLSKIMENREILYNGLISFEVRNYHYIEEFDRVCFMCNYYNIIEIQEYPKDRKKVLICERVNE